MDAVERERRALDLFDAWMELPDADREAWLAQATKDHPELAGPLRRLVRGHALSPLIQTEVPEPRVAHERQVPERIGPFRLLDRLGKGGMGSVWRAERDDGQFGQIVAIKLIDRRLFSAGAGRRFAEERRILARLRHPHIAQIFDGGETPEGDPYIVMELIQGQPITDHCTAHGLSVRARVALLIGVCEAVQYAHQELVVHADIKPANVLVDDRYGVKLLDFGIARALTEDGPPVASGTGTPGFASPQQAAGEDPVPADDIFALGRLLQALIEGQVGADAEIGGVAAQAAAAEREGRYGSVRELIDDLERWQRGVPVRARAPGRRRHAIMFVRRHWLGLGLIAAALCGLIGATLVMTRLYLQANQARIEANARFDEVRALARYLLVDTVDRLQSQPGTSALRHDLAVRGRVYLEQLSRLPHADDSVLLDVARGYTRTASVLGDPSQNSMGDTAAADLDIGRAETILRALLARHPQDRATRLAIAKAGIEHARLAAYAHVTPKKALAMLAPACAEAEAVVRADWRDPDAARAAVDCEIARASAMSFDAGADMLPVLDRAMRMVRALPPGVPLAVRGLDEANVLMLIGDARYAMTGAEPSLPPYLKAVAVLERAREQSNDVRIATRYAYAAWNISSIYADLKQPAEELRWAERGVATIDRIRAFDDGPASVHMENIVRLQYAVALDALGRYDQALAAARADLAAREDRARKYPTDMLARRSIAAALRPIGSIAWDAGHRVDACTSWRRAAAEWRRFDADVGATGDSASELEQLKALLAKCPADREAVP